MTEIVPGQAYGFFTDTSVCIGCKACEVACKQWNMLSGHEPTFGDGYDNTGSLDEQNWRYVRFIDNVPDQTMGTGQGKAWLLMSDVCKHCQHASCMDVCPTGAIIRTEFDTVYIQPDVCNGCRNCISACPYSVIGIAGAAGIAIEMVRLYQVELEHYEKIEGITLSLDGKANRLAAMIRGNLGAALQGLAVVPLFAGFDLDAAPGTSPGRIFSYDVTGGNYEERGYAAVGSGSLFARNSLKKTWRPNMDGDAATRGLVEALYDAADDDSATGGPDPVRRLYPIVYRVDAEGAVRLTDEEVAAVATTITDERAAAEGQG